MVDQEDLLGIFKNIQISVFSKAATISSTDSGENVNPMRKIKYANEPTFKVSLESFADDDYQSDDFFLSVPKISTPKPKSQIESLRKSLGNDSTHRKNSIDKEKKRHNLMQDDSPSNVFSHEKLLLLCDNERLLTVEKVMKERNQNMLETARMMHLSLEHLWQSRREEENAKRLLLEQKILDDIHEQELKNRPKKEAQLAEENMRNAQRVLDRMQRVKDAENEAIKKAEALKFYRKLRDQIFDLQKEYAEQYKEVHSIISSCENKTKLREKILQTMKDLKNLSTDHERLFKKTKNSELTEEDVLEFKKLVDMVKVIYKTLKKEVEDINAEEKKAAEIKDEQGKKAESVTTNEAKTDEVKTDVDSANHNDQNDLSSCFDSRCLQTYLLLKSYLDNCEKSCKNLTENAAMKKFKFLCQKAVTIPVNAISPVSGTHLSDKYYKLHTLLSGKEVDIGGVRILASEQPEGIAYCKLSLAKKFVRQGDLTVSSKPDAAFSIAAVLASLWIDFPDFGQLTLACFQNSCPYLAPVFMPQVEGQSTEDYYRSLGYNYTESGEVEKQDSFLKRMSGIMRLYAAVLITKVRQPGKQNPLGIAEGWRWLAAMLNLEPRPDICATLLYDFLEVAGNEMFKTYGAQFKKLLAYICQVYYPKLENITPNSSSGPLVRLEQFLQKIMKNGKISPPEGLLPPNFW